MKDNHNGTVTYTKREIADINIFLNKIYDKISEHVDKPHKDDK